MEMGNPLLFIDHLIASGQFSAWVDAHEENKNEKIMWDMYLHKLGPWDERSFADFKDGITGGAAQRVEAPSDEQLTAIIKHSYDILSNFEILEEGG